MGPAMTDDEQVERETNTSRRAVLTAMVSNLGVVVAKFIGFLITGSIALLAESLHSLADTGNQGLLLLGARRASQGASEDHPFGRGREHYFWAFVVGLVLFGMGGVVSIIEGVRKLLGGNHGVNRPWIALALIGVGFLLESWSLRTGYKVARSHVRGDDSLWRGLRESRDPDVTIVIFEDTGALVGLGLAAAGIVATMITGDGVYDAAATVAIGVLLCVISAFLARDMHALLIGEPASSHDLRAIRDEIATTPGVKHVINLRTEHIGPNDLLVCAKIEFDADVDLEFGIDVIEAIERRVHTAVPTTLVCYIEPDRYDETRADGPWT